MVMSSIVSVHRMKMIFLHRFWYEFSECTVCVCLQTKVVGMGHRQRAVQIDMRDRNQKRSCSKVQRVCNQCVLVMGASEVYVGVE